MNTQKKITLFRRYFSGLTHMYGTYNPQTKQVRVVNQPVTDQVIVRHIKGVQSYGVFLLMNDRTRAAAVDFDSPHEDLPIQFVLRANHYGLSPCGCKMLDQGVSERLRMRRARHARFLRSYLPFASEVAVNQSGKEKEL